MAETGENNQMNDTAGKQAVSFVADSGASRHALPSSTYKFNYVDCDNNVDCNRRLVLYKGLRRYSRRTPVHWAGSAYSDEKRRSRTYIQAQTVLGRSGGRPETLRYI